jgi:PhzF family phenazine biosynthesis protein
MFKKGIDLMHIPYFLIDAFITDKPFSGNPAGVCVLKDWLPDETLQNIAFENNLSETAFIIESTDHYKLRWFTPTLEMDLCGHATLAPAFLIMNRLRSEMNEVVFRSNSGELYARRINDQIELDFPSRFPEEIDLPRGLIDSMGLEPSEAHGSRDLLLIYENEEQIMSLKPDMKKLSVLDYFAVIASAKGDKSDFVSRFFAPKAGVPEDPVTGSAHSTLVPFWSKRLKKEKLHALQLSQRGGELFCKYTHGRVLMAGKCHIYFEGIITI